ncbi:MAG: hypothetical protein BWY74_03286 [Firmicutes bacterium ADurb.Bin419]|nr:MAG: hypothetical protein BWY74_03286 [Firmicutes bacterium ADurb.Bin419]
MGSLFEGVKVKWDATCKWVDDHKVEVGVGIGIVLVFIGGVWVIKKGSPIKLTVKQDFTKRAVEKVSKLTQSITEPKLITTTEVVVEKASTATQLIADSQVLTTTEVYEIERSGFIRKLHAGWNASAEKLAEAAEKGIVLKEGETLVDACTVTLNCA